MKNQERLWYHLSPLAKRFNGLLPVIVDVETAGFDPKTDALLEIAAVMITLNNRKFQCGECYAYHIEPFVGAHLQPEALEFNQIKPFQALRVALTEKSALTKLFDSIHQALRITHCKRAILVGHNPSFDLSFINAAIERNQLRHNPFHRFATFDTGTLSALVYKQTVLAKALYAAKIPFDLTRAHSAIYDAQKTAELFCDIVNRWEQLLTLTEE